MKTLILLSSGIVFLDFASAMLRMPSPSRSNTSIPLPRFFRQCHVFVHMTDDRVFHGIFEGDTKPAWVKYGSQLDHLYISPYRVYVEMPSGKGVASIIEALEHIIDINDVIPERHRCLVSIKSRPLLEADLHPYNGEDLPITSRMRCFVRMPDGNDTVYMGELDHEYGRPPSWIW